MNCIQTPSKINDRKISNIHGGFSTQRPCCCSGQLRSQTIMKDSRRNQSEVADPMKGYFTICFLSAVMAVLSVLLLHALSSIWLDPKKNLKLNEEFVYMTIAMATASAALSFCTMSVYAIQIYLVCSDYSMDFERRSEYLKQVSTTRFVATFSAFVSIPVFMTSFGCYMYMEFHRMAAIIGIAILSVSGLFIIFAFVSCLRAWNKLHKKETIKAHSLYGSCHQRCTELEINRRALQEYFESKKATSNNAGTMKNELPNLPKPQQIELNISQGSTAAEATELPVLSPTVLRVKTISCAKERPPIVKRRSQPNKSGATEVKDNDSVSTLV